MTLIPSSIVREYDIRGTTPSLLNPEIAYEIGQRFALAVQAENGETHKTVTIAACQDGRLTSPALFKALVRGLLEQGADVVDCGRGPTPLLYYAVASEPVQAGIMVTGSHNPPADNGFKMTLKGRPFFGSDIQTMVQREVPPAAGPGGTLSHQSLIPDYVARLLKDYHPGGLVRPLSIAWDPGHGATAEVLQTLLRARVWKNTTHHVINATIDGRFPAHDPDPTRPENLLQLQELVAQNGCDLGIAFDGDGDRIVAMDSTGRALAGDQLMMIFAEEVLKNNPGAIIIGDVKASQALFDTIQKKGGIPLMTRTGHSLIKAKISETGAKLAGEVSGHIFFNDLYYGFDDGLYAAIRLISLLQSRKKTLAEYGHDFSSYVNTPEIHIPFADNLKFGIIDQVRELMITQGVPFEGIDGVRTQLDQGWWLLRASNTQPMLVARAESSDAQGMTLVKAHLVQALKTTGIKIPKELEG